MNLNDNDNFADRQLISQVFDIFGWNLQNYKTYQNLALLRADFYPIGYVLAISNKAVIVCEGASVFYYDGEEYSDFEELFNSVGKEAYGTFPKWNILVEKQWTIRKNGEWISAFSTLSEMPYRKQVRC
mgnify:CR=1 FL=1